MNGVWRWADTDQQLAGGLTKLQVTQNFVETLRRGVHALKYDPEFTAGKKAKKSLLEGRERELDEAADGDELYYIDNMGDGDEDNDDSVHAAVAKMAYCASMASKAGRDALQRCAATTHVLNEKTAP